MKLSAITILCIGIGTLALVGGGGAYYYLQRAAAVAAATSVAKADPLPLENDWHSLDNYLKIQQAADPVDVKKDKALQAERLAALRSRLQPPLMPLKLVADAAVKTSPKSHWGDGAVQQSADGKPMPGAMPVTTAPKADSLVSDHAQETIATLEAFKTALRTTGGEKKFPLKAADAGAGKVAAAASYIDR